MYDLIIIGTGCTGLAAAMYAGRFNMKTLVIGDLMGGLITWTDTVENYPGFTKVTGLELVEKLREHAFQYDIKLEEAKVTRLKKSRKLFVVHTNKKKYRAKTILLATGTRVKKLNVKGEETFNGNGVHYCALCDGYAYKNKKIAVVGGSDGASKEALLLSEYGKKIYLICRGNEIKPEPVNLERIRKNKKIIVITNTNIIQIHGDKKVKSITTDKKYKNKYSIEVDAVFVAIGHIPISQLAIDIGVRTNRFGEIKIDKESRTNIPGIYAAGDVADTKFKQAITGVGEAVKAVYCAYQYASRTDIKTK